jgi:hypothetical protein
MGRIRGPHGSGVVREPVAEAAIPSPLNPHRGDGMCGEAARLLNEYNSAVVDASKAARKLAELAGTASGDDFICRCNDKTRANARLKRTKAAYERHLTEHGCGVRSAKRS